MKPITSPKLTQSEFRRMSAELALDLTAIMKENKNDVNILIRKSAREEWTVDRLLLEIDGLFDERV